MDPSARPRSPRAPEEAVRELRAVMEAVELLWEQADDAEASVIVSASQLRVLGALERGPGLNLRELGESIGSAPSALSRLCARLEAMGFVRRSPSAQSGREIELYLTHHAEAYLLQLRERREAALALVLDTLPASRIKALSEGLVALRSALDARVYDGQSSDRGLRSA
jgi:DNA-binding MarR family transcriptional regulator